MGDSFTFGLGVGSDERFGVLAVEPEAEAQVLGFPGLDVRGVSAVLHDVAEHYVPDVVVWVFLPNDLGGGFPRGEGPGWDDLVNDEGVHRRGGSVFRYVVRRAALLPRWQDETVDSYRAQLTDRRNLSLLEEEVGVAKALLSERGARLVFVIFPFIFQLHNYLLVDAHRHVAHAASRAGVEVIDLLPAFEGMDARELWVSRADHHPNARGHRIAGTYLRGALGTLAHAEGASSCSGDGPAYLRGFGELAAARSALCAAPADPERWLAFGHAWSRVDDPGSNGLVPAIAAAMVEHLSAAHVGDDRVEALWDAAGPVLLGGGATGR